MTSASFLTHNTLLAPTRGCSSRSRGCHGTVRHLVRADIHTVGFVVTELGLQAPNPDGPWEPLPSMSPVCNNPAPCWHPNGTLYLACNTGQGETPWPLFVSPDGGLTWAKAAEIVMSPTWTTIRTKTAPYTGVEDPFL